MRFMLYLDQRHISEYLNDNHPALMRFMLLIKRRHICEYLTRNHPVLWLHRIDVLAVMTAVTFGAMRLVQNTLQGFKSFDVYFTVEGVFVFAMGFTGLLSFFLAFLDHADPQIEGIAVDELNAVAWSSARRAGTN